MTEYREHVELKLTRGLKELSGWVNTPNHLVKFSLGIEPIKLPNMDGTTMEVTTLSGMKEWVEPYYDLPYLLRMMPPFLIIDKKAYFLGLQTANMNEEPEFIAAYYHYQPIGPEGLMAPFVYQQQKAKLPQDALAKLAFRLFIDDMIWKLPELPEKGKQKPELAE